jgi:hypothetical protein
MNRFQTYRGIIPVPEKRAGTEETNPGNPELGFGVAVFGFDGVSVPEMVLTFFTRYPTASRRGVPEYWYHRGST